MKDSSARTYNERKECTSLSMDPLFCLEFNKIASKNNINAKEWLGVKTKTGVCGLFCLEFNKIASKCKREN